MIIVTKKVQLKWATTIAVAVVLLGSLLSAPASAASPNNPFRGKRLYVDPSSQAAASARNEATEDRPSVSKIAATPQAIWVSEFSGIKSQAPAVVADIARKKAYPVFVIYAIPHRDCGGYSSGGATPAQYRAGIRQLAQALSKTKAAIIVEPDGLSSSTCLSAKRRAERIALIRYAATTLAKNKRHAVYLDIGHNAWLSPKAAASLLRSAGVAKTRGFSLNVSNFQHTSTEIRYGTKVSKLVGGKRFVIDTSRNGRGPLPNSEIESWCNPDGRSLGQSPTARTASRLVDAYLWVKRPGESDGPCRGGGVSGTWYNARAVEMVKNRDADLGR